MTAPAVSNSIPEKISEFMNNKTEAIKKWFQDNLSWVFLLIVIVILIVLFITVYMNLVEWVSPLITAILVVITGYYAISTQGMLKISKESLDLRNKEYKSEKVREIAEEFLIPLKYRIRHLVREIRSNRFLWIGERRSPSRSLYVEFHGNATNDLSLFISSKIDNISVDGSYPDSSFQIQMEQIDRKVKEIDEDLRNLKEFFNGDFIYFFQTHFFNYFDERDLLLLDPLIFTLMVELIFNESIDIRSRGPFRDLSSDFWDIHLENVKTLKGVSKEFQEILADYETYREKLEGELESLEKIVSSLLTEWVNTYHIPVKNADKDDFGYN